MKQVIQHQIPAQTASFSLELRRDRDIVGLYRRERGHAISLYLITLENLDTPLEQVDFAVLVPGQEIDAAWQNYKPVGTYSDYLNLGISVVCELAEYRKLGKRDV